MMMQNQELILPLSESLRIFFRESWEEGETFKLTILQYVFYMTHCIETIGGQK